MSMMLTQGNLHSLHGLVQKKGLARVLDLWDGAFEIECFG